MAGKLVRQIVPERYLAHVLKALARSVQIAHRSSPSKWGLRLNRDSIMLKVGFVEVLQIGKCIDPIEWLSENRFHQLVNHDLIPPKIRSDRRLTFTRSPYANARNCDTCDMAISQMTRTYGALLPAHEAAIRIAACSHRRPDIIRDHSPGLVTFILREVGARALQPSYVVPHAEDASPIAEELSLDDEFEEGAAIRVEVNRYERDPVARERCVGHYGTTCMACGVSLADRYGPQVIGLIHVHHLSPLAKRGKQLAVNPIRDLRPVCPNCHAVIHSTSPPRTIEEVKKMMRVQLAARQSRKPSPSRR
jgi:predicted HNH restriction endonuclease